jgi:hypothetical protein
MLAEGFGDILPAPFSPEGEGLGMRESARYSVACVVIAAAAVRMQGC